MEQAAIYQLLAEQFGEAMQAWNEDGPQPGATVAADRIAEVARFLRQDPRLEFDLLMCLSGVDWDGFDEAGKGKSVPILGYEADGKPETSDRTAEGELGVAYHLYSYKHEHRFALQVRVPRDNPVVQSVAGVWATAEWHEREAYDLVGLDFRGHPDLRRILLDDEWEGHPLRKDYQMPGQWQQVPLEGKPYNVVEKPQVEPPATDPPPPDGGQGSADGPGEG